MVRKQSIPQFKLGDRVRILHSGGVRGRIVELRGALGPAGAQVYRVRIWPKPKPTFVELLEEQLEPVVGK
ncbi:MAG: hypothetical protein HY289_01630 [Planctomycetes bacterium]|nr:hypothetical protein [Planctomycetota bacterium]